MYNEYINFYSTIYSKLSNFQDHWPHNTHCSTNHFHFPAFWPALALLLLFFSLKGSVHCLIPLNSAWCQVFRGGRIVTIVKHTFHEEMPFWRSVPGAWVWNAIWVNMDYRRGLDSWPMGFLCLLILKDTLKPLLEDLSYLYCLLSKKAFDVTFAWEKSLSEFKSGKKIPLLDFFVAGSLWLPWLSNTNCSYL